MKNMLYCGLIAFATCLAIVIVISVGSGQPLRASLGMSRYVFLGILVCIGIIQSFYDKLGAGSLVADCGTGDRSALSFLSVIALYLVADDFDGNGVKPLAGLLAIAFFARWLLAFFERIQIRKTVSVVVRASFDGAGLLLTIGTLRKRVR